MTDASNPNEVPNETKLLIGFDRLRCNLLNHAELIFLNVLETAPDDASALRLLGVTRCKMGHGATGLACLQAAVERAPDMEVAWSDLAVALREAGEAAPAAQAYARAVALRDPKAARLAPLAALSFASERAVHPFELVDYRYTAAIRHGAGRPQHPELAAVIGAGRERYAAFLDELGELHADFAAIPLGGDYARLEPFWVNVWFSGLDAMALTGMLRRHNPARFVEIGSGMSTKFARRAVATYGLRTTLTSIDPEPRNAVDTLCDRVIRAPLETCDLSLLTGLGAGDILFLDSSHRAFQGSDVTVFFTEVLPRLKPGVIVHVHDVYLPEDYISGHLRQLWNEQYLLATALLFGAERFEILFPSWFVGRDPALIAHARQRLCRGPLAGLDLYGASFWLRTR